MADSSRSITRPRYIRVFVAISIFYLFSFCLRCTYSLSVLSTSEFETSAKQILERHNQFRKCHGAPPLKLNHELNKQAQNEAIALATHKISTVDRHENFYELRSNHSLEHLATDREARWFSSPVDSWYGEIKFYEGGYTPQTDHFTRLVWRNSKNLGVGMAQSDDGVIYIVCKYDPVDDIEHSYDQNVHVDASMDDFSDVCRDFMRPKTSKPKNGSSTPQTDTDNVSPTLRSSSTSRIEPKASTESSASSKATQSMTSSIESLTKSTQSLAGSKNATKTSAASKPGSEARAGSRNTSTTQTSSMGLKPISVTVGKSVVTKEVKFGSSPSPLSSVIPLSPKTHQGSTERSSESASELTVSKGSTSSDASVSRHTGEVLSKENTSTSSTEQTSEGVTASTPDSNKNTSDPFPILFFDPVEPPKNGTVSPQETKFLKFALLLLGLLLISLAVVISLLTLYMLLKLFFCCVKVRCGNRSQGTDIGGTGGAVGSHGGSTLTSPPAASACVISMSSRPVSPPMSRPASPPMFQNTSLTRLYG